MSGFLSNFFGTSAANPFNDNNPNNNNNNNSSGESQAPIIPTQISNNPVDLSGNPTTSSTSTGIPENESVEFATVKDLNTAQEIHDFVRKKALQEEMIDLFSEEPFVKSQKVIKKNTEMDEIGKANSEPNPAVSVSYYLYLNQEPEVSSKYLTKTKEITYQNSKNLSISQFWESYSTLESSLVNLFQKMPINDLFDLYSSKIE